MFEALHNRHFVHDPFGIIEDLLAGILQSHLHHLLHGKLLASGDVVHPSHDSTRTTAQHRTHVVLPGDHLGQVVGQVRFHVVEYKQLVLAINDAYYVVGPEDTFFVESDQLVVYEGPIPGVVFDVNRLEGVIEAARDSEVDFGNPS